MSHLSAFISAILAGIAVALGSAASFILGADHPVAAAFFFSFGMLAVAVFDLHLFTDKISHFFSKKNITECFLRVFITLLGNIIGAIAIGWTMKGKLDAPTTAYLIERFDAPFLKTLLDSALCGILIYIAMHGYRKAASGVVGCSVLLGATSIISICDLDYAIFNTFCVGAGFNNYRSYVRNWPNAVVVIIFVAIGNAIGALLFALLNKIKDDESEGKKHHKHHHHRHNRSSSETTEEKQA